MGLLSVSYGAQRSMHGTRTTWGALAELVSQGWECKAVPAHLKEHICQQAQSSPSVCMSCPKLGASNLQASLGQLERIVWPP